MKIDERYLSSVALLSILLGGLGVRIFGIREYYPNLDEMQFLMMAKGETLAEVWRRGLAELHPPLAHFIRHYLLMITADIFHQRLFNVAAGMVSILGMYRLGIQVRGRFLGLFCAMCMAFFPIAVSTSITLRNYAFFMAFLSWALFYFIRYQQQEKRQDLLYFNLLLFLASSTHFTGFLVGAALGISEGLRLISAKRWNNFALFFASFLPLLLLGILFYFHYLASGTAGPMWYRLVIEVAGEPTFSGRFRDTYLRILMYFSPLMLLVESKEPIDVYMLFLSNLLLFGLYIKGLLKMYRENSASGNLMLIMWGITIFAALTNLYPFLIDRHSYYLLPFFIIPLGYELEYFVHSIHNQRFIRFFGTTLTILTVFFLVKNNFYLKYAKEFPLKEQDYIAGQQFLDQHLQDGDIIVTERFAYYYFLYYKDAGKTPYDSFSDVSYHHKTTVLAPFNPPFKPYHSWEPFHDNLKSRLNSNIAKPESKAWFFMYGWKNPEIGYLLNCDAIKSEINDYFSRDGVLIFSLQVKTLSAFLKESSAWKFCYNNYKPAAEGEAFKACPRNQTKQLID